MHQGKGKAFLNGPCLKKAAIVVAKTPNHSRGLTDWTAPLSAGELAKVKAFRSVSIMLSANDDAIDDMLKLIDHWEDITGKPFFTASAPVATREAGETLAQKAKTLIKERDRQYSLMPNELRQETYIRILVVLLIETISGKKVASKSISIASGCPDTTALRYLDKLEGYGFLKRVACPSDGRVTNIELTSEGYDLAERLTAFEEN